MSSVSVIVPIYGIPERILRICIESLMAQTLQDIEIILVDDGNVDNSGQICDEYAQIDSKIKVIHQKNQGVSVARNAGIDYANSSFIAFVDGDDWVEKETFEIAYDTAIKQKVDIVMWNHIVEKEKAEPGMNMKFNKNNINVGYYNQIEDLELFQRTMICNRAKFKEGMHGAPWGKLYKKSILIEEALYFNPKLIRSQDNEFNFRVFEYVQTIAYIDAQFYHYREFTESAMRKYRANSEEIQGKYLQQLYDDLVHYKKDKIFYDDFNVIVVSKFSDICITNFTHKNNPKTYKEKIIDIQNLANKKPYDNAFSMVSSNDFKKVLKIIVPLVKIRKYKATYLIYVLRQKLKSIN